MHFMVPKEQFRPARQPPLFSQQYWFVRLRWVAGAVVVLGGLADFGYLHWYPAHSLAIAAVGGGILAYNAALWLLMARGRGRAWPARELHMLAWLQILLDLSCLTCLTLWTGGYQSPLRGFYVFHMVFASLLLPRMMAFAVAGVAILMVELAVAGFQRARSQADLVIAVSWSLTLLATVYLASKITRSLRQQRQRLQRQNARIRAMSSHLQRQQQALVQQEKMVAVGQMAAGVAHEVANPLASMDGLLQLMERKPEKLSPENVSRLRDQVVRINTIVRQLTTFAHPGEGAWQNANLNDVVTHALEVMRFDRRFKHVKLQVDLGADVPTMHMLPAAVEQVVINLVSNALDALDGVTAPTLVVRTRLAAQEKTCCVLEVQDNGHGITPEVMSHIFEPFFTTKPVGKGTGLGLSISYSLAQKHGGVLDVESNPGQGATFRLHLPVVKAAVAARV